MQEVVAIHIPGMLIVKVQIYNIFGYELRAAFTIHFLRKAMAFYDQSSCASMKNNEFPPMISWEARKRLLEP